ncbi:hypothetical protein [uncultured Roseibium sp.]|uniref:hypothetical protein n=1 Tax=uncultured Roseibium sp. TaxID=1936171 RepID=UPI002632F772|nr:hypothetical protein [uncultured Roseibium sp.]
MVEDGFFIDATFVDYGDSNADTTTFSGDSYEVATDNDRGTQTIATDKASDADKRGAKRR